MSKRITCVRGVFVVFLCVMVVLSIRHTHEARYAAAIFFSRLNLAAPVYTQTATIVLTLMMAAHTLLNRSKHMILQTAWAAGIIVASLALTAGAAWGCGCLFRHIAVPAGKILWTIPDSNTAIVAGIGLVALAVTTLTADLAVRWLKVTYRDLNRAAAYLHGLLAAALTVLLPETSYFFAVGALLFMAIQLLITFKREAMDWGLELLATALYMPIIVPILVGAAAVPGWTMAYVLGPLWALGIFPVGVFLASCLRHHPVQSAADE